MFIIIFIIILLFYYFSKTELIKIQSDIDGQFYYVINLPDNKEASNTIAKIKKDYLNLIEKIDKDESEETKEYKKYIENIKKKINRTNFFENSHDSSYTSYSVNKGKEIHFCLRSKKTNKIHEYNTILYVAIHELAHVGCPEIGHTKLFEKINAFLLKKATDYGIYKESHGGREYCGMYIN